MNTKNKKEIHVSTQGDDHNPGTLESPLRSIQAAARLAQPGDTISVHEGIYRESINPPRGGTSEVERITYQAAPGESVIVTGAEEITGWKHQHEHVWMVSIPNDYFGNFNPYANRIRGDWFFPLGREHHTGAVYFNGTALNESGILDELFTAPAMQWYGKQDTNETHIWVNFQGEDPNQHLIEINKRQTVFYPSQPGINYLTVRGFTLTQAATPWSPPTTEQIGLIGVNWSKGWIIEYNTITHSRCTGITLGKYFDREDGQIAYGFNAHYQAVQRVIERGDWTQEHIGSHIIRNNHIAYCEQAGIVGSHGGAFCEITGNIIHDIHVRGLFSGYEQAGIKLHAPVDTTIRQNLIFNCNMGIWIDWMDQGARVSQNVFFDNEQWDLFIEISHGPITVDHNILLSKVSLLDSAQGGAYVHNLFAGEVKQRTEHNRHTHYFEPHSTTCMGTSKVYDGDERFINNLLLDPTGLRSYDSNEGDIWIENNAYLEKAKTPGLDKTPLELREVDAYCKVVAESDEFYLEFTMDPSWVSGHTFELVNSEKLGKTQISQQGFEKMDGTPIAFDTDYFGNPRRVDSPFPGPIEVRKKTHRIRIWPPNKDVRSFKALQKQDQDHETEPR